MNCFSRFFENLIQARNNWLNKPFYNATPPHKSLAK